MPYHPRMGIFGRRSGGVTDGLVLDRTWADQELDSAIAALEGGDLEKPLEMLKGQTFDPDRRATWVGGLGMAAMGRSDQLRSRLGAAPGDPELLVWLAQTLVQDAWEARSGLRAKRVSNDQFRTFHQILEVAHEVIDAAIEAAPDDPTPWLVYQWIAVGLQAPQDVQDQIFESALARQPDSHMAHSNRVQAIAPKWSGRPVEELLRFGEETAAKAATGRVLNTILVEAVVEASLNVLTGDEGNIGKRIMAASRLDDQWRDAVLAGREKWLDPERYREPGDLVAHNFYAYFLRNTRPEFARGHAASMFGRVNSIPWCYRGDPLKTFGKAFPPGKR
jgi:hypothetical protein